MLKKLVLIVLFASLLQAANAQSYDVLNYYMNGTPANGVKIKTNILFQSQGQMPVVKIDGFNYGTSETIDVMITWYIYDNKFTNTSVSSAGGFTPVIMLANENGKVVIFINSIDYFLRFKVSAYSIGRPGDEANWYQNWTAADEPLSGTAVTTLSYKNRFNDNVFLPGTGTWNAKGVGIGTTTIDNAQNWNNVVDLYGNGHSKLLVRASLVKTGIFSHDSWGDPAGRIGTESNHPLKLMAGYGNDVMILTTNGNVGIGTNNPQYKLSVNGDIAARKVRVTQNGWADYVFDSSYQLPHLDSVASYIQSNKHLPGIPSVAEINEKGLDIGDIQQKQMQKIEELQLYILQQQKELDTLRQQVKLMKELQKEIESLKEKVK